MEIKISHDPKHSRRTIFSHDDFAKNGKYLIKVFIFTLLLLLLLKQICIKFWGLKRLKFHLILWLGFTSVSYRPSKLVMRMECIMNTGLHAMYSSRSKQGKENEQRASHNVSLTIKIKEN